MTAKISAAKAGRGDGRKPDISNLIFDGQFANAEMNVLVNLAVIGTMPENEARSLLFQYLQHDLWCVCQPHCQHGVRMNPVLVVQLEAALVGCKSHHLMMRPGSHLCKQFQRGEF